MARRCGIVLQNRRLLLLILLALAGSLVKISDASPLHPQLIGPDMHPQLIGPDMHPQLIGPDMAYLGSRVAFRCFSPSSSPPVTYELLVNSTSLIDPHVDQEGDQAAVFSVRVGAASQGSYRCRATAAGGSGVSNSITLNTVTPPSNTRVSSDPSPPVVYEGSRVALSCDVERGTHLSYTWFSNRTEVTSASPELRVSGKQLLIDRAAARHAGSYYCVAWSTVQNIRRFSTSTEVQLVIKVHVSEPEISFSVFKDGDGFHGNVSCRSARGSPPADFSLTLDGQQVGSAPASGSLAAWFLVAMVPGLDMGETRCRVTTETRDLTSRPLTLEVVPVGGAVQVQVEYLFTAEAQLAAAMLSCRVRGSFPLISWFFNDSALPAGPVDPPTLTGSPADRSPPLFLPRLSPEHSGYYRCRARDSYDPTGPWVESPAVLVHVADRTLNSFPRVTSCTETSPNFFLSPMEVLTIIFCSFFLVMLAVASFCVFTMFDRERAFSNISPANSPAPACTAEDASPADSDLQNQTREITL